VGHLAVVVLWSLAGLALVALGSRRGDVAIGLAGFGWLALTLVKALGFDGEEFGQGHGVAACAVVSVAILLAGVALRVLNDTPRRLGVVSGLAAVIASLGIWGAATWATDAFDTGFDRPAFLAWLAAAFLLYAGLAAFALRTPRLRNLATTMWLLALPYLLVFEAVLVEGPGVIAVYAASGAALALAGRRVAEARLVWAACALVGVTTLYVLVDVTPLERFVKANEHPGTAAWAPLACAAAVAVLAWCLPQAWRWLAAGAAALGVYALSLTILELAARISGASMRTDFERGHTAVTAVWALIGLGLLVAGLLRRSSRLRYAGLGLFGVAIAKLFLYDLSTLSSLTRAAAFLAVGGLLLAGGLLVQRLSERIETRPGPPAGRL